VFYEKGETAWNTFEVNKISHRENMRMGWMLRFYKPDGVLLLFIRFKSAALTLKPVGDLALVRIQYSANS